ncbi:hypothetical protein KCP69_02215 [Salmonella enterica subsp. enterica]|nr:hypothetical protein KCP69_02215 [Salmonella enterica subsp. enterica]
MMLTMNSWRDRYRRRASAMWIIIFQFHPAHREAARKHQIITDMMKRRWWKMTHRAVYAARYWSSVGSAGTRYWPGLHAG